MGGRLDEERKLPTSDSQGKLGRTSSDSMMSFWSSTGRANSFDGLVIVFVRVIMGRWSMKSFGL